MARLSLSLLAAVMVTLSVSGCTQKETANTLATDQTSTQAASATTATIVEQTPAPATAANETMATNPADAASAATGTVIAHADGETPGTRVDIYQLKRTSGDTVTLKFAFVNNGTKELADMTSRKPRTITTRLPTCICSSRPSVRSTR